MPDQYSGLVPVPQDNPFLEHLFGAMCRNMPALPGEAFPDQAERWTDALRFAAALDPRDQTEWLRAADVTVKQFTAVYTLVLCRRPDTPEKQRQKYGRVFLRQCQVLRDARLRYDLLRKADLP